MIRSVEAESRFRALFATAYPALHRYARNRGVSDQDAQDLVAATLEVAWRRLSQVPADDPLPWLYGVARNVLRNQGRARRRQERLLSRLINRETLRNPQRLVETESLDGLRLALAALTEADQEILRLVAWDGLTPAQAAVALGCSPIAARSRLHRARNRLAAELGLPLDRQHHKPAGQITRDPTTRTITAEVHDG